MRLVGVQDQPQNNAKPKKVGGVTGKGFKPGQSGNPGGRPKGTSVTAELRRLLAEIPEGSEKTRAEIIARRLLKFAGRGRAGDASYAKEVLNRTEGNLDDGQKLTVEIVYVKPGNGNSTN